MRNPFRKFQEERDKKVIQSTLKAIKMWKRGVDPEVIERETILSLEDIKLLQASWDEIDKIADENGGHYVVPTKPGEVDTSDVSEYIKKRKSLPISKTEDRIKKIEEIIQEYKRQKSMDKETTDILSDIDEEYHETFKGLAEKELSLHEAANRYTDGQYVTKPPEKDFKESSEAIKKIKDERKFEWIDEFVKKTGEKAREEAKTNNTYIVYNTENGWVREYPDGTVMPEEASEISNDADEEYGETFKGLAERDRRKE